MNTLAKVAIVSGLMAAIGTMVILKNGGASSMCCPGHPGAAHTHDHAVQTPIPSVSGLPRLVELGSTTCIPCQMMKPILDELTVEYNGKLDVIFVDVMKNADEAKKYNIEVIPTQVFVDASGNELFRHVGVISKADILAKWAELGFDFTKTPTIEK